MSRRTVEGDTFNQSAIRAIVPCRNPSSFIRMATRIRRRVMASVRDARGVSDSSGSRYWSNIRSSIGWRWSIISSIACDNPPPGSRSHECVIAGGSPVDMVGLPPATYVVVISNVLRIDRGGRGPIGPIVCSDERNRYRILSWRARSSACTRLDT